MTEDTGREVADIEVDISYHNQDRMFHAETSRDQYAQFDRALLYVSTGILVLVLRQIADKGLPEKCILQMALCLGVGLLALTVVLTCIGYHVGAFASRAIVSKLTWLIGKLRIENAIRRNGKTEALILQGADFEMKARAAEREAEYYSQWAHIANITTTICFVLGFLLVFLVAGIDMFLLGG